MFDYFCQMKMNIFYTYKPLTIIQAYYIINYKSFMLFFCYLLTLPRLEQDFSDEYSDMNYLSNYTLK